MSALKTGIIMSLVNGRGGVGTKFQLSNFVVEGFPYGVMSASYRCPKSVVKVCVWVGVGGCVWVN